MWKSVIGDLENNNLVGFNFMEINIDNRLIGFIIFFCVMNIFAFATMFVDKIKSQYNGAQRISEGMLFFLATVFGSLGVYAGMFAFRHKTKKWYFIIGIPILIIQNSAFLYLVYILWSQRF
jgi:uncharacterized membrane protein YsdA (DUF1294 family)